MSAKRMSPRWPAHRWQQDQRGISAKEIEKIIAWGQQAGPGRKHVRWPVKVDVRRRQWRERRDWYVKEWTKMIAWLDAWHREHPGYERWFPLEPEAHGHEIPKRWNLERHMRRSAAEFLSGNFESIRDKPPYGIGKMVRRSRTHIGMRKR